MDARRVVTRKQRDLAEIAERACDAFVVTHFTRQRKALFVEAARSVVLATVEGNGGEVVERGGDTGLVSELAS